MPPKIRTEAAEGETQEEGDSDRAGEGNVGTEGEAETRPFQEGPVSGIRVHRRPKINNSPQRLPAIQTPTILVLFQPPKPHRIPRSHHHKARTLQPQSATGTRP